MQANCFWSWRLLFTLEAWFFYFFFFRYRDKKHDVQPPRPDHVSATITSKSLHNPYSDLSHIPSNFSIYTANRFNTKGGLSAKLYKSDETYFKNSILRNSAPIVPPKRNFGFPSRHSIALPPPRRWWTVFSANCLIYDMERKYTFTDCQCLELIAMSKIRKMTIRSVKNWLNEPTPDHQWSWF